MSPEQTGIVTENNYADPRMWADRYQEFALGGFGTGVAIGDFDHDGRPDVFVVSKTEQCRLFRNLGNWRFEDVTAEAGLAGGATGWLGRMKGWFGLADGDAAAAADSVEAWKQGAAFADVNNDGWLDIYVCRFAAPNWLFINQGDGTFTEEAAERGLAVVDASGMAAFCDYDRDGWLDVFIQTNMLDAEAEPEGRPDYLFRNTGEGSFTDVTEAAGIRGRTLAHSSTWWDYDHDGWPDIYVANDFGGPDALYRNNRDGTFANVIHDVVPVMPYSAMGADQGDVNNDGLIDLLVADMATTTHEKDQRGMASSRDLSREDADSPTLAPQVLRNTLFVNTGTGRMLEAAYLAGVAATDWTWSVRFEDLDNDGRLDLHITNGMNREYQNADLRQRIILAESLAARMSLMRESPVLIEHNLAYRNLGDLRFEEVGARWGLDQLGVSFGAAFGDLDNDGDLDVVYCNYEAGVTVLRNDSPTGNRAIVVLKGTRSNSHGVGAFVRCETASGTQVRQLVLARGYLSTSEPVLHFGLGDDKRIERLVVAWPSGYTQVLEDLPVNQRFEIAEPESDMVPPRNDPPAPQGMFADASHSLGLDLPTREKSLAGGLEQALVPFRFDRPGPAIASGDLNGDGRADGFVGATSLEPRRVLMAKREGGFEVVVTGESGQDDAVADGPVAMLDVDGDGDLDVFVAKAGARMAAGSPAYQPILLLNDGRGRLSAAPSGVVPALSISAGAVAVGDFDRDGRPDLFLGARLVPGEYPVSPHSAVLLNRAGSFADATATVLGGEAGALGLVTAAAAADIDDDGWLDLVVATEWGGIRFLRNDSGRKFEDRSAAAGFADTGNGWWRSLAIGDFNGDGRLDVAAGNVGLNTQYSSGPEPMALAFYGRFDRRRTNHFLEGYYENGKLYPRRTLKALGAALPTVKRRFRRNDDFARATLEDIVGADKLAAAQRFEATEFRSGVFLSGADGRYSFHPLPRLAQIAPIQAMVAADLNGDGRADLCAVQNSHAPIPYVGRFTGGLGQLLLGDGAGGFTPVTPRESGLVVPGEGKGIQIMDLNDDDLADLLVSRDDSTLLAFVRKAASGDGASSR